MYSFYKNTNGTWVINGDQIPPGTLTMDLNPQDPSVVRFRGINNNYEYIPFTKITTIEKNESSEYYTDLSDLISSTLLFFEGSTITSLIDNEDNYISVQNPLPADGDSIYNKDIDLDNSDFTNWTGNPEILFQSPFSASITNNTSDNPKQIILAFNRTVNALQIGFGENNGNTFSNLKISLLGSGGATRSIFDESADNTKRTSRNAEFENELFNSLLIEFHTADPVSLSNITIQKARYNLSQIQGRVKDGLFKTVGVDGFGKMKVALATDIFNRLPTSEPVTISDSSLVSEHANQLFYSQKLIGGATLVYDKATSSNILSVSNNGDIAIQQSKLRNHYQPAKAQETLTTGLFFQQAGVIKYVGYFDVDNYTNPVVDGTIYNGLVLVVSESNVEFHIYNNGTLNDSASQSEWNYDKLDGNSASGITLDLDYPQITIGELEWLGVGAVRVGFNIGGVNIPVHIFEHANVKGSGVYMRTAKLPICYMIKSVGGTGSMRKICNSVISGGGLNPKGAPRTIRNVVDIPILNGDTELVLGMRLKAADFDTTVIHESISVISRAKNDFTVILALNPTYTGTVTWLNKPNSSIQYAIGNNNLVSDIGIDMFSDNVSGSTNVSKEKFDTSLRIGKGLNNDFDELWIVVHANDGNEDFSASLNYREWL